MDKFNGLIKKIINRKFKYEGEEFACDDCVRYRGYKTSRNLEELNIGSQDMNLDFNDDTNEVFTEINSSWVSYKLTDEEYVQFKSMLLARVTE